MTKKELHDLVAFLTKDGMSMLAETGSFRQMAVIVDRRGGRHMIVIADGVLHSGRMREFLMVHALSVGGADAVIVSSDTRFKAVDPKNPKDQAYIRRVEEEAKKGNYIIADDPKSIEAFICCGRSREHQVGFTAKYTRRPRPGQSDEIVYEADAPVEMLQMVVNLIPDLWERVH